jgi:hypothetical protein
MTVSGEKANSFHVRRLPHLTLNPQVSAVVAIIILIGVTVSDPA